MLHVRTRQESEAIQSILNRDRDKRIIRLLHHLRKLDLAVAVLVSAPMNPYQDWEIRGIHWSSDRKKEAIFRSCIGWEGIVTRLCAYWETGKGCRVNWGGGVGYQWWLRGLVAQWPDGGCSITDSAEGGDIGRCIGDALVRRIAKVDGWLWACDVGRYFMARER